MAKAEIKRSPASLFGGIIIAGVILALWTLIFWVPGPLEFAAGVVVAGAIGVWTRLANL